MVQIARDANWISRLDTLVETLGISDPTPLSPADKLHTLHGFLATVDADEFPEPLVMELETIAVESNQQRSITEIGKLPNIASQYTTD